MIGDRLGRITKALLAQVLRVIFGCQLIFIFGETFHFSFKSIFSQKRGQLQSEVLQAIGDCSTRSPELSYKGLTAAEPLRGSGPNNIHCYDKAV